MAPTQHRWFQFRSVSLLTVSSNVAGVWSTPYMHSLFAWRTLDDKTQQTRISTTSPWHKEITKDHCRTCANNNHRNNEHWSVLLHPLIPPTPAAPLSAPLNSPIFQSCFLILFSCRTCQGEMILIIPMYSVNERKKGPDHWDQSQISIFKSTSPSVCLVEDISMAHKQHGSWGWYYLPSVQGCPFVPTSCTVTP